MPKRRGGFTLIEIMLVVGLVGIIAATALAPLVYTVRQLGDAQARWGTSHSVPRAFDRIYSDVRRVIKNPSFSSFKIVHTGGLTVADDDRLVMWSSAPKYKGRCPGVIIYKVVPDSLFKEQRPGLYCWTMLNIPSKAVALSRDFEIDRPDEPENPMEIDTEKLDIKDAKLVLADVTGIKFYTKNGKEWKNEDYNGDLPKYLKTEIIINDKTYSHTENFPNGTAQ
ncbi:MAG: type II secretion system protein [Synergistes sp.]|nr:type II secretion system protein [Synergistes sp.]